VEVLSENFLRKSLVQRLRCAAEKWGMQTEALESAEKPHRRWPEGRKQGKRCPQGVWLDWL
jgi:hypothetical protein